MKVQRGIEEVEEILVELQELADFGAPETDAPLKALEWNETLEAVSQDMMQGM